MSAPSRPTTASNPRVMITAVAATAAVVLPAFLTGAVGVQLRDDLGFDEAGLGLAISVYFAVAALGSAVLGRAAQRIGPEHGLRLGTAIAATCTIVIAGFAETLWQLAALLAVAGLANAIVQPAANLYISRNVPAGRLGIAVGLKQAGMPTATLLGGLAVPLLATTVGWRWAYVAACGLAVAAGLSVRGHTPPPDEQPKQGRPRTPSPVLGLLGLAMVFGAGMAGSLGSFQVSSAEAAGLSEAAAGWTLVLGSATGVTVRLLMGARADRVSSRPLHTVVIMLALGAVGLLGLAVHTPAATWLATPVAFGAGWAWPGLFNLAVVRANTNAAAAATGLTQTGTYLGAALGPLAFGAIVDASSYRSAWIAAAAAALIAAAIHNVGDRHL